LKTTKARGNFNEGHGYSMDTETNAQGKKAQIRVCR